MKLCLEWYYHKTNRKAKDRQAKVRIFIYDSSHAYGKLRVPFFLVTGKRGDYVCGITFFGLRCWSYKLNWNKLLLEPRRLGAVAVRPVRS